MAKHNDIGRWGEDLAAERLGALGFTVLDRNWRMGHLEIDIVARKDDVLVVAEVKTRSDGFVDPLEAVDRRKIMAMVRAAEAYTKSSNIALDVRFDLFAVTGTPDDYVLEHVPDAFYPPLRTYR
ncbi:MAG: YraN family protein [Muribaculaceae bacterium]|nr:YraN family protein [Muribaculaceae bacterium]